MKRLLRTLVIFALGGASLLAARRSLSEDLPAPAPLVVEVAPEASEVEVQAAVEEAMLVDVAIRAGWHESDPVVTDRLLRNLRFGDPAPGSDRDLLERAARLDMARRDPVARRRLAERARDMLRQLTKREPSRQELEAYRDAHRAAHERPGRRRLFQVFHREPGPAPALEPEAACRDAEPFLFPCELGWVSDTRLRSLFGEDLAAAVFALPAGRWSEDLASGYGHHHVFVAEIAPPELPDVEAIAAELRAGVLAEAERQSLRASLDRLRASYRVEIRR
ncbi:MAG: peptidylprolyl isomerase [Polyangiaceae bacterium]